MKTTKLFLAVCALFVCTCSFAQTKDETAKWVESRLSEWSFFKDFKK